MEVRNDLFAHDVVYGMMDEKGVHGLEVRKKGGSWRLQNGRYASKGDAVEDAWKRRMSWLEYEREKYMRAWVAVTKRLCMVERENREIKSMLSKIVSGDVRKTSKI